MYVLPKLIEGRGDSVRRELGSGPEAWVQYSPGETPPCMLMAPGAFKILCRCNVLQVPIQIIPVGVPKRGSHPLRSGSNLRWNVSGLQDKSLTIGNSPLV